MRATTPTSFECTRSPHVASPLRGNPGELPLYHIPAHRTPARSDTGELPVHQEHAAARGDARELPVHRVPVYACGDSGELSMLKEPASRLPSNVGSQRANLEHNLPQ